MVTEAGRLVSRIKSLMGGGWKSRIPKFSVSQVPVPVLCRFQVGGSKLLELELELESWRLGVVFILGMTLRHGVTEHRVQSTMWADG